MVSFIPVSPTFINILEKGLKKKKYTQFPHTIWLQGASWENIGGSTIWTSPKNDHGIIIHHDPVNPICGTTTDPIEIQGAMDVQSNNDDAIMAAITQNKPEISEAVSFPVSPGRILEFPREQWIKQVWLDDNPGLFVPEQWRRRWKITLTEPKHCQFISKAAIEHRTVLRENSPTGGVIAGGEVSFFNMTSFDLTLAPGTYYYEAFSYYTEGVFEVFFTENCTNDPERPHMYDYDGMDAFGHVNIKPPKKINLFDPNVCTITDDQLPIPPDNTISGTAADITNGSIDLIINGKPQGIAYFTEIIITFTSQRRIRQVKLAGYSETLSRVMAGSVVLQGKNNITDPWTQVTVLNSYIPLPPEAPVSWLGWVLDHTIEYEDAMKFSIYRIFMGELQRMPRAPGEITFVSEIELYD